MYICIIRLNEIHTQKNMDRTKLIFITVYACVCLHYARAQDCSESGLTTSATRDACITAVRDRISTDHPEGHIQPDTSLNSFVTLKWAVRSDTHYVCCRTETFSNSAVVLNPIANDQLAAEPLRNFPTIHIAGAALTDNNHPYTIGLFDVSTTAYGNADLPFVHWFVTNIEQRDVTTGDIKAWYLPPIDKDGYYVLMMWKQVNSDGNSNSDINFHNINMRMDHFSRHDEDMDEPCPVIDRCFFEITDLYRHVRDQDVTLTLVGATWFRISNDPIKPAYQAYWRVHMMKQQEGEVCQELMNTPIINGATQCTASSCDSISNTNIPDVETCLEITRDYIASQTDFVDATDQLYLHISPILSSPLFVQNDVCCSNINEPEKTSIVNPMKDEIHKNYLARSLPAATYVSTNDEAAGIGNNELYTVMIIDMDADDLNRQYASPSRPILHMLYVNVHGFNITAGIPFLQYHVMSRPHRYLWMEYKQTGTPSNIIATDGSVNLATYTGAHTSCLVPNSCFFELERFVSGNNLHLVGATIIDFSAAGREFYAYNLIKMHNQNETAVCVELLDTKVSPQGALDCSVSSATRGGWSTYGVLLPIVTVIKLFCNTLRAL